MRCLHLFLAIAALIFLVSSHPYKAAASRGLKEDDANVVVLQSLQRGPVSPSTHNGCTYIPGRGGPPCIGQRTFAGYVMAPPRRLQPDRLVPFGGAAANLK